MKTNLGERLMSSLINSTMPEPAITSLGDAESRKNGLDATDTHWLKSVHK
jgi:hypothetical protein